MARSLLIVLAMALAASSEYLYFSHDDNQIAISNLDAEDEVTGFDTIYSGTGSISDIALDNDNGYMYWADSKNQAIYKSLIDGSSASTLVSNIGTPSGLALDSETGHLYYADKSKGSVFRTTVDGTYSLQKLHFNVPGVMGLVFDRERGMLYASSNTDGAVYQYQLKSGASSTLIDGLDEPRMLAIAGNGQHLYITQANGKVLSVHFDKLQDGAEEIVKDMASANGITVGGVEGDSGYIYVADDTSNRVFKVDETAIPVTVDEAYIYMSVKNARTVALYTDNASPVQAPNGSPSALSVKSMPTGRSIAFYSGIASIAIGSVLMVVGIAQAIQHKKEQYFEIA